MPVTYTTQHCHSFWPGCRDLDCLIIFTCPRDCNVDIPSRLRGVHKPAQLLPIIVFDVNGELDGQDIYSRVLLQSYGVLSLMELVSSPRCPMIDGGVAIPMATMEA